LANGPSLKDILPRLIVDEKFKTSDFIVMNFFALENIFFIIKPRHYCLSDPIYYMSSTEKARVSVLYETLEKRVDWDLNLYIPNDIYRQFRMYSKISNRNIHIKKVNNIEYNGYEVLRFLFYKNNIAMPPLRNIAVLSIFVGINSGYSTIYLYGVDHTFFDSLHVDEENRLCNIFAHFYDKERVVEYKPLIVQYTGKQVYISEYLDMARSVFMGHDILERYAQYMKVKIINCTKNSLIDSYERL
jgi:hypothetical protein